MIVSLSLIRYKKTAVPAAFFAMAIHRFPLWLSNKCRFWKLMGCGKNGTFDIHPDWQQWALLTTWDNRADFDTFFSGSFIPKWWRFFSAEVYTIICEPLESHGKWDGQEPFLPGNSGQHIGPVAILTRARIRFSRLKNFWAHVPVVKKLMRTAPGLAFSAGIGEAPFFLQATFSVWESLDDAKNFAYRQHEHADVVRKTRSESWYSEELFARFRILETRGTLRGNDPLAHLISTSLQS
ncbi:MAG: DUF3291 domain-containing protein [Mucilaginibacter polytrichastri]|nr:DUF3291 domain-containing protein [Mucilaginibacter polytrichastri]